MCIKTFYILPLLSGIKSIENIFFLSPADKNGSLTRFTPHYPIQWGQLLGAFSGPLEITRACRPLLEGAP